MMKLKHNFKKGMALVLSLCYGSRACSGYVRRSRYRAGCNRYGNRAKCDSICCEGSVNDCILIRILMVLLRPKESWYLVRTAMETLQEWYILGADSGVTRDNTIIFAASPIATVQKFDSSSTNKTDSNLWSGV